MSYIHIIVEMKKAPKSKEKTKYYIQLDIDNEQEALDEIIIPYVTNSSRILIEGAFVSAANIEKMEIFSSDDDSKTLYEKESAESDARSRRMATQGVIGFFGTTMHGAIKSKAEDITMDTLRKAMKKQ
jgi:hypothetical protein